MTTSEKIARPQSVASRDVPQIPGLELIEEVGRGSHAVVYRARRGDQTYAVKVSKASSMRSVEGGLRRLRREAGLLARSCHPALVTIHEVGLVGDRPYLVMDFIEGTTLAARLEEQGSLDLEQVIELAAALAGALVVVHRQRLVHCDIKPENILVGADGAVSLVDFGLALPTGTFAGEDFFAGTFRYSAPEQTGMVHRPMDGRTDLYSLGVVLYECLTGAPPFDADEPQEVIRRHAVETPAPLGELRPEVPREFLEILYTLLAKDQSDRFDSAAVLLRELESVAEKLEHYSPGGELFEVEGEKTSTGFGRRSLLAELRRRWVAVCRSGQGEFVELLGEAGIGKGRLLQEFLGHFSDDVPVLFGRCRPGEEASAFRAAFAGLVRRRGGEAFDGLEVEPRYAGLLARAYPELRPFLDDGADDVDGPRDLLLHATAQVIRGWAQHCQGAILVIDAFDEADKSTQRIALRLQAELSEVPLLILIATDEPSGLGDDIVVPPLTTDEVGQLLAGHFQGYRFPREFVRTVAQRSRGLPVLVDEYVPMLLEEGIVRPHWGEWVVDEQALDNHVLPSDLTAYVVGRLDRLEWSTRRVLEAAALIGQTFDMTLLEAVVDDDEAPVGAALSKAMEHRLVRREAGGGFGFIHDEVRDALYEAVDDEDRRRLHQRIAETLDGPDSLEPAEVTCLAVHYGEGEIADNPSRVFELNYEAAQIAQRRHADEEAVERFRRAAQAAQVGEIDLPPHFDVAFGQSCARTGRLKEATAHLQDALPRLEGDVQRAQVLVRLSWLRLTNVEIDEARQDLEQAFEALDESLPTGAAAQLFLIGRDWLRFHFRRALPGAGRRPGEERRARGQCLFAAYDQAAYLGYVANDEALMAQAMVRPLSTAVALGSAAELSMAYYNYAIFLAEMNRPRRACRYADRAVEIAAETDSPPVEARALLHRAWAYHFAGFPKQAADFGESCLRSEGQWLDVFDYLNGCTDLVWNLVMRGHCVSALEWLDAADRRASQVDEGGKLVAGHIHHLFAASLHTILGGAQEGATRLKEYRQVVEPLPDNMTRSAEILAHRLWIALECGECGDEVDEIVAAYTKLGLEPQKLNLLFRHIYVLIAYGRLRQCEAAGDDERRLEVLGEALGMLRHAGGHPTIDAHRQVIEGARARLMGEFVRAERELDHACRLARAIDAPWVDFEATFQRALMRRQQGQEEAALRQARYAYVLAMDGQWRERARRIRSTFSRAVGDMARQSTRGGPTSTGFHQGRLQRYLDALVEVSSASMTTAHPQALAEQTLDKVIDLLGCERAFLLFDGDDELELLAARDINEKTLDGHATYSRTVVDHVWHTGESVVLAGSEEGAAWGSESIMAHDLRSIAAVPMALHEELLGVLYLDSSLARGVFVSADLDFLRAIATHIAIAIETVRTARMEATLEAVRNMALQDSLTGVPNRRHFFEVAPEEIAGAVAEGRPISAVMLDIDHFKKLNDTYGHSAGDEVLKIVARRCAKSLRQRDHFARYGGEEFVALLPGSDLEMAGHIAERLREAIGGTPVDVDGVSHKVTMSLGVAELRSGEDLTALLARADDALYRAKDAGRNAVVVDI